ncbi:unnamed protein product, partial [Sphagnum troendelagicum]
KLKGSWNDITKALVKEFSVKNVYQNLMLELSQLKQGALESVREYKDRTMTLQNKLQGYLRAQGHEGTDPLFAGINAVRVPFANFVKSFRGTSEYEEESETDQSSSSEGIYMDDSSEEESPPCMFTEGEVEERLSKIQLGLDLQPEERRQYKDLL